MKKVKKILYVGALVGAMGFGAMFGPVLSFADDSNTTTTPTPVYQYQNQQADGMGLRMGQYFAGSMNQVVADALGMTVEDLYAERLSGKSLEDIAKEKYTSKQLLELLVDAKKAQLKDLVDKNVITQEQSDYMLQKSNANMEAAIKRTEVGPMNGGKGMRGQRFNQDGTTNFTPGQGRGFGGGPRWNQQ